MSDMISLLRANPGLLAMVVLLAVGTLVVGVLGVVMLRSGASVRPIVFFGGFFAIVVVPQALFHASQAFGWIPKRDLTWTPGSATSSETAASRYRVREELLGVQAGVFANPVAVFGPDADPALTVDLRARMPDGPFSAARAAQMAVTGAGSSTVVALFDRESDAVHGAEQYASMMLGALPPEGSDGARTITRTADVVKVLVVGRVVFAWTAVDAAAADRAMQTSPLLAPVSTADRNAASTIDTNSANGDAAARDFWLYRPVVLTAITLLLLLVAVTWFFRMSAWASEVPAMASASPLDAGTLRERLLAVNALDVPFRVDTDPDDATRLIATWRYADARWVDLARARGMRRTYRIILVLDEAGHTVRPTEQTSQYDWSAGVGGANLRWTTERGIIFFQREMGRVFGLQLDATGRFTPALSYTYRFDVREIKAPLISAVTQSGWRWRPTLLHGPTWLRWLTD